MDWVQWVTLGIAVLGAGLSVFNAVTAYRRGVARLRIVEVFESAHPPEHLLPQYTIELVNPGHIAVTVKQVTLVLVCNHQAQTVQLWKAAGNGESRKVIEPGRAEAFTLPADAMYVARVGDTARVVVDTEDRRRLERRCRRWRQFRDQVQAASAYAGKSE